MTNNADIKKRNFLTQNEIESLLKAADTGPYAARNYCLTLLCFIHGLRASEICRLRISDIDLAARCVYIHRLKKGFSTTHPLLEIHPHMLRHSCGFALANMGIDTRLIQDYLGHRNIRHTVWYTASNAGRFYGIWDNPRDKQRSSLIQ